MITSGRLSQVPTVKEVADGIEPKVADQKIGIAYGVEEEHVI